MCSQGDNSPCGEGWGGGREVMKIEFQITCGGAGATPTLNPSPQGGGKLLGTPPNVIAR